MQRDVFGDGDDEGDFRFDGFEDCGGGVQGWDEDGGGGRFVGEGGECLADGGEGWEVGEARMGVRHGTWGGRGDAA